VEQGETLEEAVVREMLEEIGVKPKGAIRVATLDFYFPYVEEPRKWNQRVCVFIVREWEGEPKESEEMFPQWFGVDKIPIESMWSDAIYWLPKILQGTRLKAEFTFDRQLGVEEVNLVEERQE
jgi:8-oxo-dGTP diphosphatase